MNKSMLIINGQYINIKNSGGAGRYGGELYCRLKELNNYMDTDIIDVSILNFEKILSFNEDSFTQFFCRVSKVINKYISCKTLGNFIPNKNCCVNKKDIFELKKYNSVILHEITNYSAINEIGRFCFLANFFLLVTFLDIQDFYYPEYFNDKQLSSRRILYSFYKERADLYFAISDFTKQSMVEHLNIKPEKIIVTHLAANDIILNKSTENVIRFVNSLGRYWIYPAKAWSHKNHTFLLQTLGRIKELLRRENVKFLLTGGFEKQEIISLKHKIYDNGLIDIVCIIGFVSEEQLQALIRGAEYLVFPSLFEGFGMPILEAMTLGCPVISSNAASLPEVGGDAALYFDPKNQEGFTALLESLILDKGVDRQFLIKRGFENIKRFSWDMTFKKTVEVYKELLQ